MLPIRLFHGLQGGECFKGKCFPILCLMALGALFCARWLLREMLPNFLHHDLRGHAVQIFACWLTREMLPNFLCDGLRGNVAQFFGWWFEVEMLSNFLPDGLRGKCSQFLV